MPNSYQHVKPEERQGSLEADWSPHSLIHIYTQIGWEDQTHYTTYESVFTFLVELGMWEDFWSCETFSGLPASVAMIEYDKLIDYILSNK